ncbi:MAG: hypothetical protein F9K24_06515 [Leptonema illini]|uniref:Uncharacterized protein n=1 Tax=Leptonema illini TaxID=183 RepID=A0A833H2P6_9LEPT|nr:MAG: hypothetical protein F9K24_06515 [Leptonema illini]
MSVSSSQKSGIPALRVVRGGRLERERRQAERRQLWQRRWTRVRFALLLVLLSAAFIAAMTAYVRLVIR